METKPLIFVLPKAFDILVVKATMNLKEQRDVLDFSMRSATMCASNCTHNMNVFF